MPFYEYKCSNCGFELEDMQKMSDEPLKKCPDCDKDTLQKLIGTGGGLIFKGSGFYLTDYKKKSQTESTLAESTSAASDTPKTSKTTESKKETDKSKDKSSNKPTGTSTDKSTVSTDTKKSEITKKEK